MSETKSSDFKYRWFVLEDLNGFFGLMFDNLTVLAFMAFILTAIFKFPADIVYTKMFPGTAFGVLFGDLIYTLMAISLAKRTNNPNVTAMPLGLDTPSSIGIAFTVLGPAYLMLQAEGMAPPEAAMMTWRIGMATMVMIGCIKLVFSFFGSWVQRVVPQAGLLGSLAGIGLALIGFMPLLEIFGVPVVGMVALGLILYNLVAKIDLPKKIPGVLASVGVGAILYYLLGSLDLLGVAKPVFPPMHFSFALPIPTAEFLGGFNYALRYLPIAFPFAILTVVGGINVTESARVAGDDFNTRDILLVEAVATLVAGVCGGVAQSTPYIGQPAYKSMGSRAGYTLLTGVFIGLGGVFGYISFFVELLPKAVLAPILVFVALDIMSQAFEACPVRHASAVAFSYFPTVARMLAIKFSSVLPPDKFQAMLVAGEGKALPEGLITIALGNGFILTAMLWGGFLAALIDRKFKEAVTYILICAGLSFFGIIHSAIPDGNMYLPWTLTGIAKQIPYQFTAGYLVLAGMIFVLSLSREAKEAEKQAVTEIHHG